MPKKGPVSPYLVAIEGNEPVPVDPQNTEISLTRVRGDLFLLRFAGRATTVVVRAKDRRTLTIWAENRVFQATVSDHRDQLLAEWGVGNGGVGVANDLTAPMPGLVLKVSASPGDKVKAGQPLVVLEAMKMENELCAVSDGVVRSVSAAQGQAVAKGDILVAMEPDSP